MSSFHSNKCTPEELKQFSAEVLMWLKRIGIDKPKYRSLRCYNGEIRVYTGENMEFPNRKSSFRRTEPEKNEQGEIIGWHGERGHFTTVKTDYAVINRDEFNNLKKEWNNPKSFDCDVEKLRKLLK